MSDLEKAFEALKDKNEPYTRLINYYEGDQPLSYMNSSRMAKIFQGLDGYFAQNWCSVVIDSVRDRINLRKIEVKGNAAKRWQEMWQASRFETESDEIHEKELITGEAFVICWPNADGMMEAYHNDPRMCHVFYDAEFPRVKSFAAKWFEAEDGTMRMTLYYRDRLERYASEKPMSEVTAVTSLTAIERVANPYGEIPVFHFRKANGIRSDLKNVTPIQNAVNKLVTDMMVAAEFGAFKQRYIISNAETQGKLKNAPDEIWDLPAGDGVGQQTQAGQFDATPLSNYLEGIEKQVAAISSITRTPKHYFFQIGSNISGEALIAMESALNKKAQDRIDRYTPEWKSVAYFMLKSSGENLTMDDVTALFDRPETIQPRTQAETRQMNTNAGIPLETTLREEGKSDAEIARVMKDIEKQKTRDANMASAYLSEARRNFDQAGANTQVSAQQQGSGVNNA